MEGAVPAASRRTRIYTSRLDDKLRARGERTEFLATFFHESAAIIHDRLNFRAHPHVTSHSPPDKLTPINNDRFFTDRKLISICSPIIYFELSLSLPFLDPFASVISPIQYFEAIDESHNGTDPSHDQFSGENRRADSSVRKETADPVVRSRSSAITRRGIVSEGGAGGNFRYVRPEMGIERSASIFLSATATERYCRGGGVGYPRFASHG